MTQTKIPNRIFQTWKTKTHIDKGRKSCIRSLRRHNSEMEYLMYDDRDCELFVKDNYSRDIYDKYMRLEHPVQKADLWRYLVIYHYGGYYFDVDCYCVKPLKSIKIPLKYRDRDNLLVAVRESPRPFTVTSGFPRNPQYAQYWFGATPRHPAIWKVIKRVLHNIDSSKQLKEKYSKDDYTLYLSGPVPWTDGLATYLSKSKDNSEDICILIHNWYDAIDNTFLSNLLSKYRSIPVMHKCMGSWRDGSKCGSMSYIVTTIIILLIVLLLICWKG